MTSRHLEKFANMRDTGRLYLFMQSKNNPTDFEGRTYASIAKEASEAMGVKVSADRVKSAMEVLDIPYQPPRVMNPGSRGINQHYHRKLAVVIAELQHMQLELYGAVSPELQELITHDNDD